MKPYFEKTLCIVAQEISCTLFFWFYLTNYLTSILTFAGNKLNFIFLVLFNELFNINSNFCIRYDQTQFRRVEVPPLGHHVVYPPLSHPSYELERTISHSNLTTYKH